MSMDAARWLSHFRHNRENRSEPEWTAPVTLPAKVVRPLIKSLEQFQLGDGGGPASLIAHNAESFRGRDADTRELVDLWFAEEKEHSRLLLGAVNRFGGAPIKGHWSFTAFCLTRQWFGVRFELTVLLLTEISSTGYYRLMRRHADDGPLREMCRLILRDEAGHITFHCDRQARSGKRYGRRWELQFRILGLIAATVLWVNHRAAIRALGGTDAEFYGEVWRELSRYVRRLGKDAPGGLVERWKAARARLRPARAAMTEPTRIV
ncbi:MAG: ferritin-like domain-containing protein [Planctomycetes bacterium]|nr:ferritin-like domain-containing protein [Planctomycetota bacterium]